MSRSHRSERPGYVGIIPQRVLFPLGKQRGNVIGADAKSSAHQTLVDAAVANVKTWKFSSDTNGTFTTRYVYVLEPETTEVENPRIEMQVPHLVKITARPVVVCFDCGGVNRGRPVR